MEKTIVYIGGFELPDKNAAAHRVLSNAKILTDIGEKVVFIGIDKELAQNNDIGNTYKEIQGFDAYAVPYPKKISDWVKYLTDIDDYVKIINRIYNADLIICYNFPSIALNKLRKFCKKKGIKCLADVTEWYSGAGRSIPFKIIKGFDTWYRMRVVQKKLDGLIVISRFLELYYCHSNVVYIPTLTDLNESKWNGNHTKSKSELKLVYAGSPGRKDRIDVLVEALTDVKRVFHLDIIGITLEQYIEMYPQHKEYLETSKSIVFHGRLSHLETLEYVKRANYSCFFREDNRVSKAGFPTKLAEAISCGTPVITNASSNIKDYMDNGKNGICIEAFNPRIVTEILTAAKQDMPVEKTLFMYQKYDQDMKKFLDKL